MYLVISSLYFSTIAIFAEICFFKVQQRHNVLPSICNGCGSQYWKKWKTLVLLLLLTYLLRHVGFRKSKNTVEEGE